MHEECSAADTRRMERLANRALVFRGEGLHHSLFLTGSHSELTAGTIEMLASVHQRYATTQAVQHTPWAFAGEMPRGDPATHP